MNRLNHIYLHAEAVLLRRPRAKFQIWLCDLEFVAPAQTRSWKIRTSVWFLNLLHGCHFSAIESVLFKVSAANSIILSPFSNWCHTIIYAGFTKFMENSNSSALGYSASKIALYAILRVVQAPKCKVDSEGIYFFGCILCALWLHGNHNVTEKMKHITWIVATSRTNML